MHKTIICIFCMFICIVRSYAQSNYAVQNIPDGLLKNAHVVKRTEEVNIFIRNIGKATINTKYALTILDKAGDDAANYVKHYGKFTPVKYVEGKLFDAAGNKVKSLKKADIRDYSDTDEGTMADDSRIKQHNFNYNIYPYTVEYETEVQLDGIFYFPAWIPLDNENLSIEQSRLYVVCPKDYELRFKQNDAVAKAIIMEKEGSSSYEWSVKSVSAIVSKSHMPFWQQITPAVFLAPSNFEIQDYKGSMSTWQQFGKFIYSLNTGRDVLPDDIKQEIHRITDPLSTNQEKIELAYAYLQNHTRYISIQLGLGGWQTFDAKYVAAKGYGDCKALSNYMYSLLKEIGIKSYYTLIQSNRYGNSMMVDFPSNQFNHIILCVPQGKDTIWLECTSQSYPAGYLGSSTIARPALMIDETGGMIVHTPQYNKFINSSRRIVSGQVNLEGQLKAEVKSTYAGVSHEYYRGMVSQLSKEQVLEVLKEEIDLPSYDVDKFSYTIKPGNPPAVLEELNLTVNNYGIKTGKRLFIMPNLLNKYKTLYKEDVNRNIPIFITFCKTESDTVRLTLPPGFIKESIPDPLFFESKFGIYRSNISVNGTELLYTRYLEQNSGNFPANDYGELMNFYNKIYKADRAKLVLVKSE